MRLSLVLCLALAATPAAAQPPPDALPAILHLQLSQHPAWRAYKDAMAQTRAEGSHDAAQAALLNGMTTPERLDAMRAQLKVQQDEFERQAGATEAFYAALSPDQKQTFDQVTRLPTPPAPMHAYPRQGAYDASRSGPQVLRTPPAGSALPPPGG